VLATIILDVPVEFDEKDFEMCDPDIPAVTEIFQELEFRRLQDNFLKTFSSDGEASQPTVKTESPGKSPVAKKSTAGSGQFSLFAGDGETPAATTTS